MTAIVVAVPAQAAPPFTSQFEAFPTGAIPVSVALGDLNGDGHPEIVSANVFASTVSILFGGAVDPYTTQSDIGVGSGPESVVLARLDPDPHLDVVTANYGARSISVLRGQGDGTLSPGVSYPTALHTRFVRTADLNGDARPDLVTLEQTTDNTPGNFGVFLNRGDGTFEARRDLAAGGIARDLALGDVDGDGRVDLVAVVSDPNRLVIFTGGGDGTFPSRTDRALVGLPLAITLGRLDGDARPDLALAYEQILGGTISYRVEIALGAPGGFVSRPDVFADGYVRFLGLADADGDGATDLIVATNHVTIVYGSGDGAFGLRRRVEAGVDPQEILVMDLDADTDLDVVGAAPGSGAVIVSRQNGDGSFGAPTVPTAHMPQAVVVDDFDADGRVDFAVTSAQTDAVSVHRGQGDGTFGPQQVFATGPEPTCLASGDFDGDRIPDLVTTTFFGAQSVLTFLHGLGDGRFAPKLDRAIAFPATCVATGHFNDDAHLDVAATLWSADWPLDGLLGIYLGRGDGVFDDAPAVEVPALPWALEVADLDADGNDDLVVTFRRSPSVLEGGIAILRGQGDGRFAAREEILLGYEPRGLTVGDTNEDGIPDLVVANSAFATPFPGSVSVLLGLGGGAFNALPPIELAAETQDVALVDFDADSHLDLVAVNAGANTVSILHGAGTGLFGSRRELGVSARPLFLGTGDVNGDGRPDLVVSNSGAASVSVLLNTTLTTSVTVEAFDVSPSPDGIWIRWRIARPSLPNLRSVALERSLESRSMWTAVTPGSSPPRHVVEVFDPAPDAAVLAYRLRLVAANGSISIAGPVTVHLGTPDATRLLAPQVEGNAVQMRFRLERESNFRLEIHDVRGRRLWGLEDRATSGVHMRSWDLGAASSRHVARGVYWVRLDVAGRAWTQRFVWTGR